MSKESKHTPGPWSVRGVSMEDGSISIGSEKHRIVIAYATNAASLGDFVSAAVRGRRDFGAPDTAQTQWANARLIAAAPDMLAALKLVADSGKFSCFDDLAWDAVNGAIAKAEGGPPQDEINQARRLFLNIYARLYGRPDHVQHRA